jgi:hypothetical protein
MAKPATGEEDDSSKEIGYKPKPVQNEPKKDMASIFGAPASDAEDKKAKILRKENEQQQEKAKRGEDSKKAFQRIQTAEFDF